jgi:hypothetical protein
LHPSRLNIWRTGRGRANLHPEVRLDVAVDGFGIRGGTSFGPEVNADGRYVAFDSQATNLIPNDTNTCSLQGGQSFPSPGQCPDIFVRDLLTDTTVRVSVDSGGAQSNGASTTRTSTATAR